jgi:YVTN family beta-propeller protein
MNASRYNYLDALYMPILLIVFLLAFVYPRAIVGFGDNLYGKSIETFMSFAKFEKEFTHTLPASNGIPLPKSCNIVNNATSSKIHQDSALENHISKATTFIQTGMMPTDVSINAKTNKVYVVNSESDSISIINGTNDKAIKELKAGVTPIAIAINPLTNKIYVANYGDNSISVLDGKNDRVISKISLLVTPIALAVNPLTNHIYISNYITGLNSMKLEDVYPGYC